MKILYKTGNLLNCEEHTIVHGCNSLGVMGAGVALAIRKAYPEVYEDYKDFEGSCGLELEDCITTQTKRNGKPFRIISAITQKACGSDANTVYVSYDAIQSVFRKLNNDLPKIGIVSIAFPKIGAGLANGDWSIIEAIIEEECTNISPVCYVW